jgi:hypothetical protein
MWHCKREYKKQLKESRMIKVQKAMKNIAPSFVLDPPSEFFMAHYFDDEGAVLGIPDAGIPGFLRRKAQKKMKKNLEGFFKENKIKVKIEIIREDKKKSK